MTFHEAYHKFGPDTMAIAEALDIPEADADSLINNRMENKARNAENWKRTKAVLSDIRARRPA